MGRPCSPSRRSPLGSASDTSRVLTPVEGGALTTEAKSGAMHQRRLHGPSQGRWRTSPSRETARSFMLVAPDEPRQQANRIEKRSRMKKRQTRWILPCTFALALTACASGQRSTGTSPGPEGRELERLEALFQARADSVTSNVSEADVEFMTGMISHPRRKHS